MDIASLAGLVVCIAMVIFGIAQGDDGIAGVGSFIDVPSLFITLGGSFSAVLAMSHLSDYINGLKTFTIVLKMPKVNEAEMIKSIIDLSNVARKEGLLALEEAANDLEDPLLKKGILLIVDGTDPELVRAIMETELTCMEARHKKNIKFWNDLATMGPAWGMIGTLIGLINMLKKLDDPSAIGPNMAVALITTLYGSMLANWVCTPVAEKLGVDNSAEVAMEEVVIEGLLSIQAGENPRVIEEKLKSFLSPKQRAAFGEEGGGEQVG